MLLFECAPTPIPMPTFNCPYDDMKRVASPTQTHMLVELGGGTCGMCYDLAGKMSAKAHVLQAWFTRFLLLSRPLWNVYVHVCIFSLKQLSRSTASLHYCCYYYYYYYLRSGLSLNPELIISLQWLTSKASGTCLSPHSSDRVTDVCHHICLSCGYVGTEPSSTNLRGKYFTH